MIWEVSAITFFSVIVITITLIYSFSPSEISVSERLTALWHQRTPQQKEKVADKPKAAAQRVLADLGKLLPADPKKLSYSQRLMTRAGYRRPQAAWAFRGTKLILPVGLLGLVYFTGIYQSSPLFIIGFALLLGYLLPDFWLTWRIRKRQHVIRLGLPDALDLLLVCVEAGLGIDQAFMRVSQELRIVHPELSEEIDLVNAEIRVGKPRLEALRDLAVRTGVDDIKALVAMLIQTDRFGTSISQSLRVHSDDLRTKRRQRAEEMAAKTTVKMVPPLVFCIFPALFAVILGPAVITIARDFLHK